MGRGGVIDISIIKGGEGGGAIDISIIKGQEGGGAIDISIIGGGGVFIDISIFGAFEPKPLLRKIKLKVALRKLPFVARREFLFDHQHITAKPPGKHKHAQT